ncbi:hypothetical protein HMPREF3150_01519 [Pseudomonas aeruginosa]|nr:hypothetical protein HMPREF3150_01519 [Pseudomonas aeruginosa]
MIPQPARKPSEASSAAILEKYIPLISISYLNSPSVFGKPPGHLST